MSNQIRHRRIWTGGSGSSGSKSVVVPSVSADGLLTTIPKGYMLEVIVGVETGGASIDLRFGTSASGSQIDPGTTFDASKATTLGLNYVTPGMLSAGQAVYVSDTGAGWGASVVDIYLILRKVL